MLGYSVGENGLSKGQRQKLLTIIVDKKLMTPAEIKNLLEFYIRFLGKNQRNEEATKAWLEDIEFVNELM